ncbi:MspA family porin [Nocardia otitidiscaviarum]|uniref:MspA n=2 Tax=Nocardia TaxID=1817 RepID=A0A379JGY6_9NOCA|nr:MULTISPECIES: MspA family porin [Nocardia]MBF6132237.1 MspA family porin [Nocardia otitidiscaviarum]MBF6236836.1 MspA family porin [Nocardia otitidiscaviarum]MCP9623504.1 MspA family porin [Nocardia otitidiscaviarum]QDP78260.1 MspA family porin [Nocardia otitidiscaviarum]SUD47802.1 MspA [Nocardia otitidiscaviarum]
MTILKKAAARLAGVAATATVALGLFSPGAAHADTFIPLPGGEITQTLPDGTAVTIRLVNESVNINPSMGATPLHRNVWASGRAEVEIHGEHKYSKIYPGYVVGCQVDISGGNGTGGANAATTWEGKGSGGVSTGGNLTLGPGQASTFWLLDLEGPDAYGEKSYLRGFKFTEQQASVNWKDSTLGLSGCAGYAQARAFVGVEVTTKFGRSELRLWGQPFSLG